MSTGSNLDRDITYTIRTKYDPANAAAYKAMADDAKAALTGTAAAGRDQAKQLLSDISNVIKGAIDQSSQATVKMSANAQKMAASVAVDIVKAFEAGAGIGQEAGCDSGGLRQGGRDDGGRRQQDRRADVGRYRQGHRQDDRRF